MRCGRVIGARVVQEDKRSASPAVRQSFAAPHVIGGRVHADRLFGPKPASTAIRSAWPGGTGNREIIKRPAAVAGDDSCDGSTCLMLRAGSRCLRSAASIGKPPQFSFNI